MVCFRKRRKVYRRSINSKGKKIFIYLRRFRDIYKSECLVDRFKKFSRFKVENREGFIFYRDRLYR